MRDHRPAVVFPGLRVIELVSPPCAMLDGPELSGLRMKRGSLHIAMTVRPDLRSCAAAIDERIVTRNAPIGIDANDFPDSGAEILRLPSKRGRLSVSLGHEELAISGEHQA